MITASLQLGGGGIYPPRVDVLTLADQTVFASLEFGSHAGVILPGVDLSAALYLRRVAAVCLEAADEIATKVADSEAVA